MTADTPAPRALPRRFDPFAGDRELQEVYLALQDGRWDDFLQRLGTDRSGWLASWLLTGDDAAVETTVFRRLVEARPSALALTLLGGALARDAWASVAGHRSLAETPAPVRTSLEARMGEAEGVLREAADIRPDLVEPGIHLIRTGGGLRLGAGDLAARFEAVQARSPFRPDAVLEYLAALGPRRRGNDSTLFELARRVEAGAAAGSPARLALPVAHIEYGLGSSRLALGEHLGLLDTVAEIGAALGGYLDAAPSPATPADLLPLNAFALAMAVVDRETARLTAECFRRIDNRPTSYPWSLYRDDIVAVFAEVQRSQLRAAADVGGF